jgi:malonyl CoA-acyl carrier protein transacylase
VGSGGVRATSDYLPLATCTNTPLLLPVSRWIKKAGEPQYVAGYSVGEVAAWGVGRLIDGFRTLDFVAARTKAMDAANQGDEGTLFVREAAIAIVNPGDAYVLGGRRPALAGIAAEALRSGAARAVTIPVEVASHTSLMKDASTAFFARDGQCAP